MIFLDKKNSWKFKIFLFFQRIDILIMQNLIHHIIRSIFSSHSFLIIIRERKFPSCKLAYIINSMLYKSSLHEIITRLLAWRTRELKPSKFDDDRVKRQLNRTVLRAARRCRRRRWWWNEKWVSRENGRTVIHSTWHKRGESAAHAAN